MMAELGLTMTQSEMVAMNRDDYSLGNTNVSGEIT
jgi:hypothetical protein